MKKMFTMSFVNSSASKMPHSRTATERAQFAAKSLVDIKQQMALLLADVQSLDVERMRYRLQAARSINELWMQRSDLYLSISRQHGQTVAASRINSLLASFSGWVADKQLTLI
jgi:hypothetical protein